MKCCLVVLGCLAAAVSMGEELTVPVRLYDVSHSHDRQTQRLTVTYRLENQNQEPAYVTMDVLTNGVSIGLDKIKTPEGDISQRGFDLTAAEPIPADGDLKTIVWNPRKDWYGNLGSNVTVVLSAWYTNTLPGVYMVVDLSGGPAAARYPVSYSLIPPDPEEHACRSSQLWFRYVPAGSFMMGAGPDDSGHLSNDEPINAKNREDYHAVTLTKPFFAGVFEVTCAQYQQVLGTESSMAGRDFIPVNHKNLNTLWGEGFDPSESNDVAETSFFYALRQKTGLLFTLPTDAQWEYACRAGTTSPFNVDTNVVEVSKVAWYKGNSEGVLHEAGQTVPNAWGFYDMHGNVSELCRDYMFEHLGTTAVTDPLCRKCDNSNQDFGYVVRGGYYKGSLKECRTPYRAWRAPDNKELVVRDGIRVWLTLEK